MKSAPREDLLTAIREIVAGEIYVSRDLAMIKVGANAKNRAEIMQTVAVFRARVVDVTPHSLVIEVTGDEQKVDGLVDVLKPLGIIEMVRTGAVAMSRGGEALMNSNGNGKVCGSLAVADRRPDDFKFTLASEMEGYG